eukprot:scaffold246177_cov21-Prasinocladus_malaysianus.AAC.1
MDNAKANPLSLTCRRCERRPAGSGALCDREKQHQSAQNRSLFLLSENQRVTVGLAGCQLQYETEFIQC